MSAQYFGTSVFDERWLPEGNAYADLIKELAALNGTSIPIAYSAVMEGINSHSQRMKSPMTYTLTFANGESFGIHVERQTSPRRPGWHVTTYDKDGVSIYESYDWSHKSTAVSQATAMLVARIEGD